MIGLGRVGWATVGALAMGTLGLTAITAGSGAASASSAITATPIKHVVVVFQENVSFDHYFGTYPNATNPNNEPSSIRPVALRASTG